MAAIGTKLNTKLTKLNTCTWQLSEWGEPNQGPGPEEPQKKVRRGWVLTRWRRGERCSFCTYQLRRDPELNFMNVGSGRGTCVYTHMCVHILAYLYVCVFIRHLNPKPQALKPNPNLNPILFTNCMCVSLGHIYRRIVYMQVEFRSSGFGVSPSPVEGLGFSLTP